MYNFDRKQERKSQLEDLGVDGWKRIQMDINDVGWYTLDWIHLAQNWDKQSILVNTVMNLRTLKHARKFLTS
jgi:hypothetical protein